MRLGSTVLQYTQPLAKTSPQHALEPMRNLYSFPLLWTWYFRAHTERSFECQSVSQGQLALLVWGGLEIIDQIGGEQVTVSVPS